MTNKAVCGIIYSERERNPLTKGNRKMEKVVRICEITGKVTTVATNLPTAEAMALVAKLAKEDTFATYHRVV